jgi:hypothetical protein
MKKKDAVIKLAEEIFGGDWPKVKREAAFMKKAETDPVAFAHFAVMLSKLWGKDIQQVGSLLRAKLAAQFFEFWDASEQVTLKGNRQFFIDLGKCLSPGGMKAQIYSKLENDIAELVFCKPHLSAREAVRELAKRHHQVTEDHWRMEKMRLLRVLSEIIACAEKKLDLLREAKT